MRANYWHCSARPIDLHLPILTHNAIAVDTKSEELALATAKQQIEASTFPPPGGASLLRVGFGH
jgi:hypothetical protein